MNIHVGNQAREVTEAELRQAFEPFGQVAGVRIVKDRNSVSRGFGFVEMADGKEAANHSKVEVHEPDWKPGQWRHFAGTWGPKGVRMFLDGKCVDRIFECQKDFKATVLDAQKPVLVDFWAAWCGPCKMIAPVIEELAKEYSGRVKIVKMNVDENMETPNDFSVRSIPTLILYKNGKEIDRMVGVVPKSALEEMIKKAL